MMLAPVYLLDGINGNFAEDTDYLIAQKDGYFGRDCSRYHHQCPASLFAVSICFYCKERNVSNLKALYKSHILFLLVVSWRRRVQRPIPLSNRLRLLLCQLHQQLFLSRLCEWGLLASYPKTCIRLCKIIDGGIDTKENLYSYYSKYESLMQTLLCSMLPVNKIWTEIQNFQKYFNFSKSTNFLLKWLEIICF